MGLEAEPWPLLQKEWSLLTWRLSVKATLSVETARTQPALVRHGHGRREPGVFGSHRTQRHAVRWSPTRALPCSSEQAACTCFLHRVFSFFV